MNEFGQTARKVRGMSVTVWILLMLWSSGTTDGSVESIRTEAKYLAFNTEQECEEKKKEFIISRVNADAISADGQKLFSATCSSVTVQAKK